MRVEEKKKLKPVIEATLFAYGEPQTIKKLAETLEVSERLIKEALNELENDLKQDFSRGLCLIRNNQAVQLGTKPEHYQFLEKLLKQDFQEELSPAALEVLTIVLYRAPISRAEIDFIRGVNSTYILRVLLMRGLIQREINPKNRLAFLYQSSFELLRFLGLTSQKDLPDFESLNKKLSDLIIQDKERQKNEDR
jgi:segregation and condensation protein B